MKITPLYHNVLVRPQADGDVTRSGLLVPAIAQRNSPLRYGEVVATGAGRINAEGKIVPLAVKAGDVILFARNAGIEVPSDDLVDDRMIAEVLLVIEEKYILGVVDGLPVKSTLMGIDGRLLEMTPQSRTMSGHNQGALHDSSYKNQEGLDRAEKDWGEDTSDHVDEVS